jgi:hypothetical protein
MFIRVFSLWLILLAVSVCTSAAETFFEVVDDEENSFFGTIAALDRTQIEVNVQGTNQTIPLTKLVKIRNLASSPYEGTPPPVSPQKGGWHIPTPSPSGRNVSDRRLADDIIRRLQSNEKITKKVFPGSVVALEIKDGSRLTASSFTVTKEQGVCRLLEQESDLSLPLEQIAAVRLAVHGVSDVINPPADWLGLAVPNTEGDRLVVGNSGTFDVYTGILGNITAETLSFMVDGEVLPIPRRRVFGFVLHGEAAPPAGAPLATLTLWSGTRGRISDIQLHEDTLTWQTATGLTVSVPLDSVNEIDFGEKGIAYLIDFEQVRKEFALPFAAEIKPEQLRLLQTFYGNRTQASREVVLDGVVYGRGITLLGAATLEYRLPKPFAALRAVIGVEDQFRPYASARLQILADSQSLGTWDIRGDAPAQRISLNLPQNCKLITIITEPLPQSDVSTVLTITDAKFAEF